MSLDISALSDRFTVRRLNKCDIPAMLALAESNSVYYRYHSPAPQSEAFWTKNQFVPLCEERYRVMQRVLRDGEEETEKSSV